MKMMRRFNLLLMGLFCFSLLWAENPPTEPVTIPLHGLKGTADEIGRDKRSLSIEPYAQYDASTLYLSAPLPWEDVEVTLYDAYGNMLFTDSVTLNPTAYQVELEGYGVQSFVIEIATEEIIYYGEFSL